MFSKKEMYLSVEISTDKYTLNKNNMTETRSHYFEFILAHLARVPAALIHVATE
jgi:hypothetical protein